MEKRSYMRSMCLLDDLFSEERFFFTSIRQLFPVSCIPPFRQIFSLVLAFILLLNSIGYYPLFKLKQWEIHTEMKSLMRNACTNENLQCIAITDQNKQELEWEWEWEAEQEFIYKNNRYDVIRTAVKDNLTYYYCIQDTQEDKLFSTLEKKVEQQMEDEKIPLQNTTKKLIKTCNWIIPIHTDSPTLNQEFNYTNNYSIYHCLYASTFSDRITPPPKPFLT